VTSRYRPTVADVDLEAIRHNVRALRPPGAELMAVVKADGYGHGDVPVARAALQTGATWLGVALVEEGLRLRDAGIDAPVLLLSEPPAEAVKEALHADLTPTLYSEEGIEAVAGAAGTGGRAAVVHMKVDTGMHRVGADPEAVLPLVRSMLDHGLEVDGVWTHLARAEEVDAETTRSQLDRFADVLRTLEDVGIRPRYRHAANSAGTIAWPETRFDLVRVGIAMYGIAPGPALAGRVDLRPAMALRSRVAHVRRLAAGEAVSYGHTYRLDREATIVTIPIGYADGYLRALSSRGHVLIRGHRHPVAGVVTMDQLMVDCGDDHVERGDEVVLIGRQGDDRITAEEVAEWAGTIPYEIVCAVSARVPREHHG
jgi:alanine racemase